MESPDQEMINPSKSVWSEGSKARSEKKRQD
jgi:hypothetical protein